MPLPKTGNAPWMFKQAICPNCATVMRCEPELANNGGATGQFFQSCDTCQYTYLQREEHINGGPVKYRPQRHSHFEALPNEDPQDQQIEPGEGAVTPV